MADLNEILATTSVKVIGADLTAAETFPVNADSSGSLQTAARNQDGAGTAINSIADGAGLNGLGVSHIATNYVLSTLNNTTAQLASGATFTGGIENVYNQQAISVLLTSDQVGTLTINQYIDLAGTRKISSFVYVVLPSVPFSRSFVANGNYFNISFQNTGLATTTTLNINIAYGTIPASSNLGNAAVSLDECSTVPLRARPDGFFNVAHDPQTLLFDSFETLDTTNTWTTGGTTIPSVGSGSMNASPGTLANATSYLISKAAFTPVVNGFLQWFGLVKLETGIVTGSKRFWGLGSTVTPTFATPMTDGAVFEVDGTTGLLYGAVYAGSVRTQTTPIVRPVDGNFHRYEMYYKSSKVYFEIDNILQGTINLPNLNVASLFSIFGSLNGSSTPSATPVLIASVTGVGDSARNGVQISDATFPWRKAKVDSSGLQYVAAAPTDSSKATYSVSITNLATAATATDIFTLTGSATKTIRINYIRITGNQSVTSNQDILLIKRSTANTGGTSTAPAIVAHDSANAAASATALAYTANPTLGTAIGTLRVTKAIIGQPVPSNAQSATAQFPIEWTFGNRPGQAIVLRGTSQVLAINLNSQTLSGSSFDISIEFTEE